MNANHRAHLERGIIGSLALVLVLVLMPSKPQRLVPVDEDAM